MAMTDERTSVQVASSAGDPDSLLLLSDSATPGSFVVLDVDFWGSWEENVVAVRGKDFWIEFVMDCEVTTSLA